MSSKSKQQLKLDNNTLFPNNNNGYITPDKLRTFHTDLVDSFATEDGITILSTELSSEISRAISTEASLSTSIDSISGNAINQEISDRISADASLSTALSSEKSTRTSADTSLSTSLTTKLSGKFFTSLSSLVGYLNNKQYATLGTRIMLQEEGNYELYIKGYYSSETQNLVHINNFTELLEEIDNGTQFGYGIVLGVVSAKDEILTSAISTETSTRISADASLSTAIGEFQPDGYVPYSGATESLDMGDNSVSATSFNVYDDNGNPVTISFNVEKGTLDISFPDGTSLQVGQEGWFTGKASGDLTNGSAVQFAGIQGGHILVKTANISELNSNPSYFMGVATQSYANGDIPVKVTWFGEVNDLNTYYWYAESASPILYVATDPLHTGYLGLTTIKPGVGYRKIEVASITRYSATVGQILVRPTFGMLLTDLDDVNDGASNDGDILVYNETAGYFEFSKNINDYALSTSLSTEISDRLLVESSIITNVSAEAYNRNQGDQDLYELISNSISTEASTRLSVDASLSTTLSTITEDLVSEISTEVSDRTSADASLTTLISTEVSDRTSADASLTTLISTEVSDRTSADASLTTALSSEVSRAIEAEASLSTAIGTGGGGASALADLTDVTLTTLIDNDIIQYNSSTSKWENVTAIDLFDNVAEGELFINNGGILDGILPSAILSTEESTRLSADTSLSTALSTEISDRTSADTSLSTALSTEISDRISADLSLSTAIGTGGGGSSTLADLTDTTITTPGDGDLLRYDAATSTWINYVESNFVKNNTDTYTSTAPVMRIITLTQSEYDAISSKDGNALYIISI